MVTQYGFNDAGFLVDSNEAYSEILCSNVLVEQGCYGAQALWKPFPSVIIRDGVAPNRRLAVNFLEGVVKVLMNGGIPRVPVDVVLKVETKRLLEAPSK